ncbi:MAG: Ig-like domain-containing protein [Deltaproteobacteria bacterium]|nr:Ig-like domain-containing protein [Deltaproteobacteria bacterium]
MTSVQHRRAAVVLSLVGAVACGQGRTFSSDLPDTTPPTVTSVSPADGAVDQAQDRVVVVTFSEAMDPASLDATTITWTEESGSAAVAHTLSYADNVLTLTPAAPLASYRWYAVRIDAAVTDTAKNALGTPVVATFQTHDGLAPATPAAPTDVGLWSNTDVAFNWTATTDDGLGVTSYRLQVDTTGTGANLVLDADVGDVLTFEVTGTEGQTLFARVAAVDGAGNQSAWSTWSDGITVDIATPTVPGTPTDAGTYLASTAVIFTWTAATDATSGVSHYLLQVDTSADPASSVNPIDVGNVLSRTVTGTDGIAAFARVAAVDVAGRVGAYSAWSDGLTVDVSGPGTPALTAPAAYTNQTSLAFSWSSITDATSGFEHYELCVATATTACVTPTYSGALTAFTLTPASDGNTYYAEVRGVDALGNPGDWSAWSGGTLVDTTLPPSPANVADAGTIASGTTLSFTWDPVTDPGATASGVDHYLVQMDTAPNPASLVTPVSVSDSPATLSGAMHGQRYYVRVAAVDRAGNSGAFSAWTDGVKVDTLGPTAPGAPSTTGRYARAADVTFTWGPAEDDGAGLDHYELRVNTVKDATGSTTFTLQDVQTHTVSLADATTYYAQVRAVDAVGNPGDWSAWSDPVTVDLTVPGVSGIPTTPQSFSLAQVVFSFSPSSDGGSGLLRYELQVAAGAPSTNAAIRSTGTATTFTYFGSNGTSYYARVRALDNAGWASAWSDWSTAVTVDNVGPTPPAAADDGGSFTSGTITFDWAGATDGGIGVASYTLEIAVSPMSGGFPQTVTGLTATQEPFDPSALADATVVSARVRGVDSLGNVGSWSAWSDGIGYDKDPPTAPGKPTAGGSTSGSTSFAFSYAAATDAASGVDHYVVEVCDDQPTPSCVTDTAGAALSYLFTQGVDLRAYTARVAAVDAVDHQGMFSPWSDPVGVDVSIPGQPGTPWNPAGAYLTATGLTTYNWAAPSSGGAVDHYRFRIGTSPAAADLDDLDLTAAGTATSYAWDTTGLADGTELFVQVAAVSAAATLGLWSVSSTPVMLDTTPPSAPGAPQTRGAYDDRDLTFTYAAATDAASGVDHYLVEVEWWNESGSAWVPVAGSPFSTAATALTLDATSLDGRRLRARVGAQDRAGLDGALSGDSAEVTIDTQAPMVYWSAPNDDWFPGTTATASDLVVQFSEPMDTASVEAAFALLDPASAEPAFGYAFFWSADLRQLTVMPDTEAPDGISNIDILKEQTQYVLEIAGAAADRAGNTLWGGDYAKPFSTADETPPGVLAVLAGGVDVRLGLVDPAAVEGGDSLRIQFSEPMNTTQLRAELYGRNGSLGANIGNVRIVAATAQGGVVWYTPEYSIYDLTPGAGVVVSDCTPAEYDVNGPVDAVDPGSKTTPFRFSVAHTVGGAYSAGCRVTYNVANGLVARFATDSELELTLGLGTDLAAGDEYQLALSNVSDAAGNWSYFQTVVQVRAAAADDTVGPTMVGTLPADGATAVGPLAPILLSFSEPVALATLAGITVSASDRSLTDFELQNGLADNPGLVALMPRRALVPADTVTVTVPTSVTDLAGNPLVAAQSFTFTTADVATTEPVLFESIPPAGSVAGGFWNVELALADALAGAAVLPDPDSVDADDVLVHDGASGLVRRGFRVTHAVGAASIDVQPPPRLKGFEPAETRFDISSATAAGGTITYTTAAPTGLVDGERVSVWFNGGDSIYGVGDQPVTVIDPLHFSVAASVSPGTSTTGGQGSHRVACGYTIDLSTATGFADVFGNPMAETSLSFTAAPPSVNRVPAASGLREVSASLSMTNAGYALEARASVRDADNDDVTVTVELGSSCSASQTVKTGPYGYGNFSYPDNGGGPPSGPEPACSARPPDGLSVATITLDDGVSTPTVYERPLWMFASAPAMVDIHGPTASYPPDASTPVVVAETPTPTFAWTNVDTVNADVLQLFVADVSQLDGDRTTPLLSLLLGTGADHHALPTDRPLTPALYLWAVAQLKMAPTFGDPIGQAWSIDLSPTGGFGSFFLYAPSNDQLAGRTYAVAELGLARGQKDNTLADLWDSHGSYDIEDPAAGAPVWVDYALTRENGASMVSGAGPYVQEMLAYDATSRSLMITESWRAAEAGGGGMPWLQDRGSTGRSGEIFILSQSDSRTDVGLTIGADRYATSGFSADPPAGTWVFVMFKAFAHLDTGSLVFDGDEAAVGEATFGISSFAVSQVDSSGTHGTADVPYTVDDAGLLSADIDGSAPGTRFARGYIGGAANRRVVVAANDSQDDAVFLALMAEKHTWLGTESLATIAGTYSFVNFAEAWDPTATPEGFSDFHAARGTGTLKTDGTFDYSVEAGAYGMVGSGVLSIDPAAERIYLDNFELVGAKGLDLLMGISVDPAAPNHRELLILTR